MANQVYANNREVSCKAAAGKSICAFPDVCMTPPQTPATPPGVPIPYPNTGMASDCTDGSSSVRISGQEVMLKNKSYFKKSLGDEAGCAPMKGAVTHKNMGKVYFNTWSMDVKVEGENVVRHFDLTTHNHGSATVQTPPQSYADQMVIPPEDPPCKKLENTLKGERKDLIESKQRIYKDSTGKGKPSTLAVGVTLDGPPEVVAGHSGVSAKTVMASRKVKRGGAYAHYAKGIERSDDPNKPTPSNVRACKDGKNSGERFVYRDSARRPTQGHAEAKIIEEWFSQGAPGTLILNVSKPTCPDCARLIREVNCSGGNGPNCNKIKVCDNRQSDRSRNRLKC